MSKNKTDPLEERYEHYINSLKKWPPSKDKLHDNILDNMIEENKELKQKANKSTDPSYLPLDVFNYYNKSHNATEKDKSIEQTLIQYTVDVLLKSDNSSKDINQNSTNKIYDATKYNLFGRYDKNTQEYSPGIIKDNAHKEIALKYISSKNMEIDTTSMEMLEKQNIRTNNKSFNQNNQIFAIRNNLSTKKKMDLNNKMKEDTRKKNFGKKTKPIYEFIDVPDKQIKDNENLEHNKIDNDVNNDSLTKKNNGFFYRMYETLKNIISGVFRTKNKAEHNIVKTNFTKETNKETNKETHTKHQTITKNKNKVENKHQKQILEERIDKNKSSDRNIN